MKKAILFSILSIVLMSACKKEIPSKETPDPKPIVYSDFPTNYLKFGNYWIYESRSYSDTTYDSVTVESFIVIGEADTFYGLAHHDLKANTSRITEYVRITSDGILQHAPGDTIVNFSSFPENIDSACGRSMKCYMHWGPWGWDRDPYEVTVGCYKLMARWYVRRQDPDAGCSDMEVSLRGEEGYSWVRGVGLIGYSYFTVFPTIEQRSTQLIRFSIKH
jgi:hypothetical protein